MSLLKHKRRRGKVKAALFYLYGCLECDCTFEATAHQSVRCPACGAYAICIGSREVRCL